MALDCGGDCWGCVGLAEADFDAPLAEDHQIGREIAQGWRNSKGEPKPQAFFIANPPTPLSPE